MRHRITLAHAIALLGVASLACLDDSPTTPLAAGRPARLRIHAQIAVGSAVDRTLRIRVFYRRLTGGAAAQEIDLPVTPTQIVVPSGTTHSQEVAVGLSECFGDAQRLAPEAGCRFSIELTLIDADGEMLSRQTQDVSASSPGETVEPPPIVLPAAEIDISSTTVALTAEELAVVPAAQSIAITSTTGAPLGTLSSTVTYTSGEGWLTHSIDQSTRTLLLQPSTTEPVAPVTYTATVTVRSSRAGVRSKDITVTYSVTPRARTLTVAPHGTGSGRVTSAPAGIDCTLGEAGAAGICSASFPHTTQVTLTAAAGTGTSFTGFTGECSGTSCQLTMDQPRDQPRSVGAAFAIARHRLTVTGSGNGNGIVRSSPAGIECTVSDGAAAGGCTADFAAGTQVTLTATPQPGSNFAGFSGACEGTSCQVTMDQGRSVEASFALIRYRLTVTASGTGAGRVTSSPAGIDCAANNGSVTGACSVEFSAGTQVTLTATTQMGSSFSGFGGDCSGTSCQVTMNAGRAVVAGFSLGTHRLTISGSGDGRGRVTSSPSGIDCGIVAGELSGACAADFGHGSNVTLTATPEPGGHGFSGWSGACTGGTCSLTMDAPKAVTASFTAPPTAPGVISNGTVWFGILPTGNLNVRDGAPPSAGTGTTTLGLRYLATNYDAISPGCECEGWGVADAASGVTGYANASSGNSANLTVESFTTTPTQAVSVVTIGTTFRVTHDYRPSAGTPFLFEVRVSIANISDATVADLRYRRVMDWDVEPTAFNEFVTIQGSTTTRDLLYASDNGFASADPLSGQTELLFTGDAVDSGPSDHGTLFDFGFGTLAPGATKTFTLYYGAAGNERDALAALRAVNTEVYSLGQPSSDASGGTPNTFMIGFTGVGGVPIVPASAVRAPAPVAARTRLPLARTPASASPATPHPRNRKP